MGDRQTSETRGSTDRDLWCEDIARLLLSADGELGLGSTTGAVIAAIERGGATTGDGSSERFHAAQIDRVAAVEWHRRAFARWNQLPLEHRATLTAHYLGRPSGTVASRFDRLAGVALEQWLASRAERRAEAAQTVSSAAADVLAQLYEEIPPWEARLEIAELQLRAGTVCPYPVAHWSLVERNDPAGAFRARAAARLALSVLRPLRSRRDAAIAEHNSPTVSGSAERDVEDLDAACRKGAPPGLADRARAAVVAAHRAWYATGQTGEDEAPRTKRERRQQRVNAFFREVDS